MSVKKGKFRVKLNSLSTLELGETEVDLDPIARIMLCFDKNGKIYPMVNETGNQRIHIASSTPTLSVDIVGQTVNPLNVTNVSSILFASQAGNVAVTPGAATQPWLIQSGHYLENGAATPTVHINSGTDADLLTEAVTVTASVVSKILTQEFWVEGDATLTLVNGAAGDVWTLTGRRDTGDV